MNSVLFAIIIVGVIGVIAGIGLAICSVLMEVKKDEKIEKIREALPGANCGACGYSGCDGYAEAVAKGEAEPNLCAPGGEASAKSIGEILGTDVANVVKKKAVVVCNGDCNHVGTKVNYKGIKTCAAVNMLYNGDSACEYGCLGYGDCVAACTFDAITVVDNKAQIDIEKCSGCGKCVKICPKSVIALKPATSKVAVLCQNKDKGVATKKVCSVGCIGCKKCTKICEHDAIQVENNLAIIDTEKCTNCGKCAAECPVGCIKEI